MINIRFVLFMNLLLSIHFCTHSMETPQKPTNQPLEFSIQSHDGKKIAISSELKAIIEYHSKKEPTQEIIIDVSSETLEAVIHFLEQIKQPLKEYTNKQAQTTWYYLLKNAKPATLALLRSNESPSFTHELFKVLKELGLVKVKNMIVSLSKGQPDFFEYLCNDNNMKNVQETKIVPLVEHDLLIQQCKERIVQGLCAVKDSQEQPTHNDSSFSFDGKYQIVGEEWNSKITITETAINSVILELINIDSGGNISKYAWSPNNHYLAYVTKEGFLCIHDISTNTIISKQKVEHHGFLQWSPQGNYLVNNHRGYRAITLCSMNDGTLQQAAEFYGDNSLIWAPNETFFAICSLSHPYGSKLYTCDSQEVYASNNKRICCFSPDSLYFVETSFWYPENPFVELVVRNTKNFAIVHKQIISSSEYIHVEPQWLDNGKLWWIKQYHPVRESQEIDFASVLAFKNLSFTLQELVLLQNLERAYQCKKVYRFDAYWQHVFDNLGSRAQNDEQKRVAANIRNLLFISNQSNEPNPEFMSTEVNTQEAIEASNALPVYRRILNLFFRQ